VGKQRGTLGDAGTAERRDILRISARNLRKMRRTTPKKSGSAHAAVESDPEDGAAEDEWESDSDLPDLVTPGEIHHVPSGNIVITV
jgi:hypothetical protein